MPATTHSYVAPDGLPFAIALDARAGTLHAEVTGAQDSLEVSIAFWRELAAEAARRGTRRLLVVDRLQGTPLPPASLAELVRRLVGIGLEDLRIAYVEPVATHVSAVEHGQIFAAELGFDVRVFHDVGAAGRWLRYGDA